MKILVLKNEETWPEAVLNSLEKHYKLLLNWELHNSHRVSIQDYDKAIDELQNILRTDYVLHGYHCTRLTDQEIQQILINGLQLPDLKFLSDRINTLEQAGLIESKVAKLLKSNNQANDSNRKGMIWFCFYQPSTL